jgi:cysteine-rich repeat protein
VDGTSRGFRWTSGWMGLQFNRTETSCEGGAATHQLGFLAKWGPVTYGECGDALLDTGEACDDANTVAGDGCSPLCQVLNLTPYTLHPKP